MQMPDVVPAFERVVFDGAGFIWVERFRADDSAPRDWIVFDASGRVIGRIEVPARLVIEYIGPDHVLARWRDDLDVEHAGRFRLARVID